ncbi:MAG: hypothetical protein ACFE0S_03990 [Rhodospirillales bacterium]
MSKHLTLILAAVLCMANVSTEAKASDDRCTVIINNNSDASGSTAFTIRSSSVINDDKHSSAEVRMVMPGGSDKIQSIYYDCAMWVTIFDELYPDNTNTTNVYVGNKGHVDCEYKNDKYDYFFQKYRCDCKGETGSQHAEATISCQGEALK